MSKIRRSMLILVVLWVILLPLANSKAQESSTVHILFDRGQLWDGHLHFWLVDEQTGNLTSIVDMQPEFGRPWDFSVDVQNHYLYYVSIDRTDNSTSLLIGPAELIRYDWETHTEEVVYTRPNLTAISNYRSKDKLVLSYYPEDTRLVYNWTPISSCVFDLSTRTCYEMGDVTSFLPKSWIWLDPFRAIRVSGPPNNWGKVDLIDIKTGSSHPVDIPDNSYISFGQAIAGSTEIFLLGSPNCPEGGTECQYHLFHLDTQTLKMTHISSLLLPKPIDSSLLSPDGKYLLFRQADDQNTPHDLDRVQVIDVETGEPISSWPLWFTSPSGSQLPLVSYSWGKDDSVVLAVAEPITETDYSYIVSIDVQTGVVRIIGSLDQDLSFVQQ